MRGDHCCGGAVKERARSEVPVRSSTLGRNDREAATDERVAVTDDAARLQRELLEWWKVGARGNNPASPLRNFGTVAIGGRLVVHDPEIAVVVQPSVRRRSD